MEIVDDRILIDEEQVLALNNFISNWVENYVNELVKIPMFDVEKTKFWNSVQKIHFAKSFYHARGHFYKFLWFLGNFAPNYQAKKMILENIEEEFGKGKSHEEMYIDFANSIGADLRNEIIHEENHLPFIQQFNKGHLEWLDQHDWESRVAAFSAYEKLDNVDYDKLLKLAISIDASRQGQVFFIVHNNAKHFARVSDDLVEIWLANTDKVKYAFDFISKHQLTMWKQLSDTIFNYNN